MNIYIDESGDFNFKKTGQLKYSLVGSIIIPDSKERSIAGFFTDFKKKLSSEELDKKEIKGSLLCLENRFRVCKFLSDNPDFKVSIFVADTEITNDALIDKYRKLQYKQFKKNRKSHINMGGKAPSILKHYEKIMKLNKYKSRFSNSEYVEGMLINGTIRLSLQKSTICYFPNSYRNDLGDYHFILDKKLKNKLSPMEKYLSENIKGFLGFPSSIDKSKVNLDGKLKMTTYEGWGNDHPFKEKYCRKNHISINKIFEHGLEFKDSKNHTGLTLIDIICNTIYKSLNNPKDYNIIKCFNLLKGNLLFSNSSDRDLIKITGPSREKNEVNLLRYSPFISVNNLMRHMRYLKEENKENEKFKQ
ncbi:DUF3800 domain-containing protein [bacterium]|nr:DUF3800 domain-containing protein [bacterium]